jgi:hypothetical protein
MRPMGVKKISRYCKCDRSLGPPMEKATRGRERHSVRKEIERDLEEHDECPDGFSNDAEYYRWKNG